jgi:hypothetical protein
MAFVSLSKAKAVAAYGCTADLEVGTCAMGILPMPEHGREKL